MMVMTLYPIHLVQLSAYGEDGEAFRPVICIFPDDDGDDNVPYTSRPVICI